MNADGCKLAYKRRNKVHANNCVLEHKRYGGIGVIVWGAINHKFKSQLVVCQGNLAPLRYINQVLGPVVVPMFAQRQDLVFQQDNNSNYVAIVFCYKLSCVSNMFEHLHYMIPKIPEFN